MILTTVKHFNRYDNGATAYVTGNDIGGIIWSDVLFCRFVLQTASMIRNIYIKIDNAFKLTFINLISFKIVQRNQFKLSKIAESKNVMNDSLTMNRHRKVKNYMLF